jgi:vanillate/3-O-methylgallate O-demethylase
MQKELQPSLFIPYDPNIYTLCHSEGQANNPVNACGVHPFEYTGWWDEMLAYQDKCAIHAGLNPTTFYRLKGPDVIKFLSDFSTNSYKNWPVGKGKHVIMCNKDGYIMKDGVALLISEDEVLASWLYPYIGQIFEQYGDKYDLEGENLSGKRFIFQLTGPLSLKVAEAAAQEDLSDIPFIGFRYAKIAGKDVMVLRVGMSGTLAYEIQGATEDATAVYEAILEAGKPYDLTRIGRHAYRNTHVEGGFPQLSEHFASGFYEGYREYQVKEGTWGGMPLYCSGSMGNDVSTRWVTPVDVGWEKMINLDHDFLGKEVLEKEKVNPSRRPMTLVWNPDDIVTVWRSIFDKNNPPYALMDFAEDFNFMRGSSDLHNDKVLAGDEEIGMSCGRMFSPKFRDMISLGLIKPEYAKEGTEVEILWGEPGTRQIRIRATVSRFPYINEGRNENIDVKAKEQ